MLSYSYQMYRICETANYFHTQIERFEWGNSSIDQEILSITVKQFHGCGELQQFPNRGFHK